MKIVFICGSVEPGKNGVGDYSRRLCSALIHQGVAAEILSLNDKHIKTTVSEIQENDGNLIKVKRIPISAGFRQRLDWTSRYLKEVQPDWISLQYVPYSFDLKGIPFWLPVFLKKIRGPYKCHIMFHELATPGITIKNKLYRFVQIQLLKSIVSNLKPKVVHTHTPFYLKLLSDWNIKAKPLPVFSNIKKVDFTDFSKDNSSFKIGLFSRVKSTDKIIQVLEHLSLFLKKNNKTLQIVFLGGEKAAIENFQKKTIQIKKIDAKIIIKGFLKDKIISEELQKLDLGITPVPIHALGKSGSVAAFLEHGIPIIAPEITNRKGLNKVGFLSDLEKKYLINDDQFNTLKHTEKLPKINNLNETTKLFMALLNS